MRIARAMCLLLWCTAIGCARPTPPRHEAEAILRIGVSTGRMSVSSPDAGLAQIKQNIAIEPLASFSFEGRPRPAVAESWTVSDDRRLVTIRLRPNVVYQDGTRVGAAEVAAILARRLPRDMGPAYEDIESIDAVNDREVAIRFKRASGFRVELLDVAVQKSGRPPVGTGPYVEVPAATNELRANEKYYLGKPAIDRIRIETYPTFRAAWADMLRNRNDMLYEIGGDALESLQNATATARVFTYTRRYQYLTVLNSERPALRSADVRQALNLAIDRDALVRDALNGHGEVSIGPVSPRNWAMVGLTVPQLGFDPARAAAIVKAQTRQVRFTCLVLADFERIALVMKHQLEAVGAEMVLEPVDADRLFDRLKARDYDAFITDAISGPTMYRLYRFWHTAETFTPAPIGNASIDVALDQVRHSGSDDEYRKGVAAFVTAVVKDPPAIFLAWSQGARAVSRRFTVPADPERPDPLADIWLWHPANAQLASNRN